MTLTEGGGQTTEKDGDEAMFDIDGRRISVSSGAINGFDKVMAALAKKASKAPVIGNAPIVEMLAKFMHQVADEFMARGYKLEPDLKSEYWFVDPNSSIYAIPGKTTDVAPWYFWDMVRREPATNQITNSVTHAITLSGPRVVALRAYLDRQVTPESLKEVRDYLKTCAASMKCGAEVSQG